MDEPSTSDLGIWFNARKGAVARTLNGSACECGTTHEGERGVACGGCGWQLLDRVTLGELAEPVSSIAIYPLAPPAAPPVDEEAAALARAGVFVTPWSVCSMCHRWAPSAAVGMPCMAVSGTCPGVLVQAATEPPKTGVPRGPLAPAELARLRIGIWVHAGRGEMALAINSEPCDCPDARSPDGDLYTHARGGAPRCPCGWTFVEILSDWVHAPARGDGRWRAIRLGALADASDDGAQAEQIVDALGGHGPNQPAEYAGQQGFWVQGDCVFLPGTHPQDAIQRYRQALSDCAIGIAHNHFCGTVRAHRAIQRADALRAQQAAVVPRALRSAHEGAAAAVRAAAVLIGIDYLGHLARLVSGPVSGSDAQAEAIGAMHDAVKRAYGLLSDALLLLTETPPRFDFGGALFERLIKSYGGSAVRPGVYRLELSVGNLRSAISIVDGDERAVWTQTAERTA